MQYETFKYFFPKLVYHPQIKQRYCDFNINILFKSMLKQRTKIPHLS